MNQPTSISPDTLLVVKLEAQQWNLVLAGLGELKLKDAMSLWHVIMEQLQPVPANGVDQHPPSADAAHA